MHHLEESAHQTPGPIVHVTFQVALRQIPCPQFEPECTYASFEEVVPTKAVVVFCYGEVQMQAWTQNGGYCFGDPSQEIGAECVHYLWAGVMVPGEPLIEGGGRFLEYRRAAAIKH